MTEASFTTQVMKWAKTYGFRCFHVRNSGHGGMSYVEGDRGFPDLLMTRGTRLVVAELKIWKAGIKLGEPKPEQQRWLDALRMVGAETYVWRPENWSEILAVLA